MGLKDLGYNYVLLDDCWSAGRGSDGYLIPDTKKFPRGMAAVADAMHERGLLFGMYSSAGEYTCARYREWNFPFWWALEHVADAFFPRQPDLLTLRFKMQRASPHGGLTISSTTTAIIWDGLERR